MIQRRNILREQTGTAASEMALVVPLLLVIMMGSLELGNYFLSEHAITKQVRDGARFASRLPLETNYTCPGTVGSTAATKIANVTKTGTVSGSGELRFSATNWADQCAATSPALQVSLRCVDKTLYGGVYQGLASDIPVVKVAAAIKYNSVLNSIGFDSTSLCLRAESEAPVVGL